MIRSDSPNRWERATATLVHCPTCGLPAEITDRFTLGGAPGPIEHVKIVCVRRHWYTLPVDMFPVSAPASDLDQWVAASSASRALAWRLPVMGP
jgi:hypothetical protein